MPDLMKAEIVATLDGITELELQAALQGLRNVEQENPARIMMTMLVTAPDIPTDKMTDILKGLKPPLPFTKVISKSSTLAVNRPVHEE